MSEHLLKSRLFKPKNIEIVIGKLTSFFWASVWWILKKIKITYRKGKILCFHICAITLEL